MEVQVILISLLCSGFFSGMEIAFISANQLKLEVEMQKSGYRSRLLQYFTRQPSRFISTTLVGNNVALILFGINMAMLLEAPLANMIPDRFQTDFSLMLGQTLISTALVLVVAEFLPKVLFRINPNAWLNAFVAPMWGLYLLFYPFVMFMTWLAFAVLRLFKPINATHRRTYSRHDLETLVEHSSDEKEGKIDKSLFNNMLYLMGVKVKGCMVPRNEIQAVDVADGLDGLRNRFIESKMSRLIVYKESLDEPLGYVHHHSLLRYPPSVESILFPLPVVPETMNASDLLQLFMKKHQSIAWVVDEFGATAGIVTLEDVLEEIFGEIQDEHDSEEFIEQQLSATEFLFSGRLEVDHIHEKYDIELPISEAETLSGLVVEHHGSIPEQGELIIIGNWEFKMVNVADTRIETVGLKFLS